jgi:hypothetical protein
MNTNKSKPYSGTAAALRRPWLAIATLFLGVLVSAYLSLQLYADAGAPLKYRVLRLAGLAVCMAAIGCVFAERWRERHQRLAR